MVDFAWNSGQHDLVSPVELFDTAGMDADVLEIADELVKTGKEKDPLRAIAEAEAIHRKKLALRMTVRERQSRYHMVAFDPFEVGTILGVSRRKHTTNAVPVTLEQQLRLDNLFKTYTIDYDGVTRAYARNLLTEIDTRRQEGLCTHRQLATLIANGVDQDEARAMAFDEASSRIGELVGKR